MRINGHEYELSKDETTLTRAVKTHCPQCNWTHSDHTITKLIHGKRYRAQIGPHWIGQYPSAVEADEALNEWKP